MRKLLLLVLCFPFYCLAQKQANIWYFGINGGLDFNSGSPQPITGQTPACMGHAEGSSVISDSTGALQFYTNGNVIWNRNHELMPNGTDLDGSLSATQSSLILPKPGSNNLYYVFTVDAFFCGSNLAKGLRYSIVDMCLDSGKGSVIPGSKNISLTDSTAEKLTAVKDENGTDYWIITRKYYTHKFYAWHLTSTGLTGPIVSSVNLSYPPPNIGATTGAIGPLKASPDGQLLASASGNMYNHMELFQFDNMNGNVVSPIEIPLQNPNHRPISASFSPDNSKVYFSIQSLNPTESKLIQYDLAGGLNASSIATSATVLWNLPGTFTPFLGLQLGPNGKLYFMGSKSVINQPNLAGLASDLQQNAVTFNAGTGYVFPNFLDSFKYGNGVAPCLSGVDADIDGQHINFYPNPTQDKFNIDFPNTQQPYDVSIYDQLSRLVFQRTGIISSKEQVDISNLTQGLFLIKLSYGELHRTYKLVKH